jgi:hypothetical protein
MQIFYELLCDFLESLDILAYLSPKYINIIINLDIHSAANKCNKYNKCIIMGLIIHF